MTEQELIQKATKLIRRYDNMRILGARGEWSGSSRQGFMFNPQRGGGSAGGGGPTPPPPETGACCLDGDCSITSEALCVAEGGTYQGDDTTCDPNPCPQPATGACCRDESCSIETQEDCESDGGIYQGDDTTCDPNPCELLPCDFDCGGFLNPDDGLYYNRIDYVNTVDNSGCPPDGFCESDYPEGCPDPGCNNPWGCNQIFTVKDKHVEQITSRTYDADCEFVDTTETLAVQAFCSHAVNIEGTGCDLTCGDPIGGENLCPTLNPDDDPAFYTVCGVVITEVVYSEPCIP